MSRTRSNRSATTPPYALTGSATAKRVKDATATSVGECVLSKTNPALGADDGELHVNAYCPAKCVGHFEQPFVVVKIGLRERGDMRIGETA